MPEIHSHLNSFLMLCSRRMKSGVLIRFHVKTSRFMMAFWETLMKSLSVGVPRFEMVCRVDILEEVVLFLNYVYSNTLNSTTESQPDLFFSFLWEKRIQKKHSILPLSLPSCGSPSLSRFPCLTIRPLLLYFSSLLDHILAHFLPLCSIEHLPRHDCMYTLIHIWTAGLNRLNTYR